MEDRYMRLKSVLEDIELSEQEEKTLQWLSEWGPDTVYNIVSIMQKLNNKQQYMIQGMFKLMDKINEYPNSRSFTVDEITGISNRVYFEITDQKSHVEAKTETKPEVLNEYNLVDQLTKFFNKHPEISNQMNISNSDVEDFMDSIYDEDGEFHKDWLKQEVMDAVSEPVDISMDLHNVDLSEEQLTDYNMNLQACIDKTDKLSRTIDWLLEKNPEYYKELSNCQATMKYNSEWMKDDMKLLDDRMNKVLSENIEKAVDQVIDATEPEVDFGMEM